MSFQNPNEEPASLAGGVDVWWPWPRVILIGDRHRQRVSSIGANPPSQPHRRGIGVVWVVQVTEWHWFGPYLGSAWCREPKGSPRDGRCRGDVSGGGGGFAGERGSFFL
jgi:hypothetical protein